MAAGEPFDGVVVGAEESHCRVAIVDGGDVDRRPLAGRGGGQCLVQPGGGGGQVAVIDQQQVGLGGPAVEVEVLGIGAAAEQDEQHDQGYGMGEGRAAETPLHAAQQGNEADGRQEEDERNEAQGAQVAGHDLVGGQRRGQDHHQRSQQEQQDGRALPVPRVAAIAQQAEQPAEEQQPAGDEGEQGAAGQVEAQVGVAAQEEHGEGAGEAFGQAQALGAGRDLTDAHPEGVGVEVEPGQQRQGGQKGDEGDESQLAQPDACVIVGAGFKPAPANPAPADGKQQRQQAGGQQHGEEPRGQIGVGAKADEQPGEPQPRPTAAAQAAKESGHGQRLEQRLADDAEAESTEQHVPEADRQQGRGQQGDAAVGQHLAAEPIGGGDGQQAEEGRGEAQGEEGVAQSAAMPPAT